MIGRGLELVGNGLGRVASTASALSRIPGTVLGGPVARDPDVGRLGPLTADDVHRLPAPGGGEIVAIERGHGPTLVLVHGVLTTSRVWTKQFRDLPGTGLRTVAFDHRGHGSTTGAPPTSLDDLVDDLVSVLEGLDVRDAVLVGHSTGAMAAIAAAARHAGRLRDRVRGLVLLGATARFAIAGLPGAAAVGMPLARGVVASGVWSRFEWSRLMARASFGRDPRRSQVDLMRVLLASTAPATVLAGLEAMAQFDVTADLGAVGVPALVVNGTADLFATPADARRLVRALPDARLELVPGAGHMVMLEAAGALEAGLRAFVRDPGAAS